ncbi:MAG: DUF4124 domain-containing protein [Thermodesulfobacteriota bacterium]|nr:DUF4124 domain-containing protein [Thermodesulfobacteriota bacterium]
MRFMVCLSLVFMFIGTAVAGDATTYSCRDQDGQLHLTDNLQALPEECRGVAKNIKPVTPDNLNYVPSQPEPQGSGIEFQQAVRDAERKQQQEQVQVKKLLQRAEQLAAQYRQAVQEKRKSTRRWSYGAREIIQKAEIQIEDAREGKKQLLDEMDGQKIAPDDNRKIAFWLAEIAD